MARRSFESGGKGVCGFTQIANGREPVADRLALPVAIGLPFLLLGVRHSADCLVDAHGELEAVPAHFLIYAVGCYQ